VTEEVDSYAGTSLLGDDGAYPATLPVIELGE
jgi:hypothetical protein